MRFDDRDEIHSAFINEGRAQAIKLETLNPFKLKEILESLTPTHLTDRVKLIKERKVSICQAISDTKKSELLDISVLVNSTKTYEKFYGHSIHKISDDIINERNLLDPISQEELRIIRDSINKIHSSDEDSINSNRDNVTELHKNSNRIQTEIDQRENITLITDKMGLPDIGSNLSEIADEFNELDSDLVLQFYYDVEDAEKLLIDKINSYLDSNFDLDYSADDFSEESINYAFLLINSNECKLLMYAAQTFMSSLQRFILEYTAECFEIAQTMGCTLPYLRPPLEFWESALSDISAKFPDVETEDISAKDLRDVVIALAIDQNSLLTHCKSLEIDFVSYARDLAGITALSIHAGAFEDESF